MCLSKPKIPQPAPVIERQPYKNPAPFSSFFDPTSADARRRLIAGIVTGPQGDTSQASTTRGVVPPGSNSALGGGSVSDTLGGGASMAPGSGTTPGASDPVGTTPISSIISVVTGKKKTPYGGLSGERSLVMKA